MYCSVTTANSKQIYDKIVKKCQVKFLFSGSEKWYFRTYLHLCRGMLDLLRCKLGVLRGKLGLLRSMLGVPTQAKLGVLRAC